MSIFGSIASGLSKAASFLVSVFTKTSTVVAILEKITPTTLAAILAVFYDVVKFITSESATAGADIASGNYVGAINDVFSANTKTLLAQIAADAKTLESDIAADLQALGITDAPPAA